jgi:hypothetical protein
MKALEHPSLHCVFCDDIRDEKSGKTSIIGWYGAKSVELPPEGPLLLASFGIVGLLGIPLELKCISLKMDLLQDDHILQSVTLPEQALSQMLVDEQSSSDPTSGRQTRIAIMTNNLTIEDPCIVRMRITLNDTEINSNGLRFVRPEISRPEPTESIQ